MIRHYWMADGFRWLRVSVTQVGLKFEIGAGLPGQEMISAEATIDLASEARELARFIEMHHGEDR